MFKFHFSAPTLAALSAAFLFGASTPFAKQVLGQVQPLMLAGFLYLGSGVGLLLARLIKDQGWMTSGLQKSEWPWLLTAIGIGGVLGPFLFMLGLKHTNAATSALLLNLEAVLTAVFAWVVFKENADKRIVVGMLLIVAGGVVLSWPTKLVQQNIIGPLMIASACVCWAIDNNLTRKISHVDAFFVAGSKGFIAGIMNVSFALFYGANIPTWFTLSYVLLIGFFGYGVSLVLFVRALSGLGAARTGAYFSTAPFIGAAIAIFFFSAETSLLFWIAAILMMIGVWIHLTENHEHVHTHSALYHHHLHYHDEHHQHQHDFEWDGKEPHSHPHQHDELTHSHPHYPDSHHRHKH